MALEKNLMEVSLQMHKICELTQRKSTCGIRLYLLSEQHGTFNNWSKSTFIPFKSILSFSFKDFEYFVFLITNGISLPLYLLTRFCL